MSAKGLRNVTGRMSGLADTLSRAADGYSGARTTDMVDLDVDKDLREHKWTPRPDRGLDGTLPPIPITELRDRRGYARGWHRGPQWITLWFTSPYSFAYADSSDHGRHHRCGRRSLRDHLASAVAELAKWAAAQQESHTVPFDATYLRATQHVFFRWGGPLDSYRCDEHGHPAPDEPGHRSVWACPSDPDFRLCAWGTGDEPAHVTYWAGPVADMAHLVQITGLRLIDNANRVQKHLCGRSITMNEQNNSCTSHLTPDDTWCMWIDSWDMRRYWATVDDERTVVRDGTDASTDEVLDWSVNLVEDETGNRFTLNHNMMVATMHRIVRERDSVQLSNAIIDQIAEVLDAVPATVPPTSSVNSTASASTRSFSSPPSAKSFTDDSAGTTLVRRVDHAVTRCALRPTVSVARS